MRSRGYLLLVAGSIAAILAIPACTKKAPEPVPEPTSTAPPPLFNGVILLSPLNADPDPVDAHASRGLVPDKNRVRWLNDTAVDETITFISESPLVGNVMTITVNAGALSSWYSIRSDALSKQYKYHVNPDLKSGTPPGEPSVTADP